MQVTPNSELQYELSYHLIIWVVPFIQVSPPFGERTVMEGVEVSPTFTVILVLAVPPLEEQGVVKQLIVFGLVTVKLTV